jgi:uncharacterized protein YbaR (Trm112 family)
MFIELIDILRCPNAHEESWLVLVSRRMVGRDVFDGVLGCPVCQAEYSIVEGVVRFSPEPQVAAGVEPSSEEDALRLAALLDLASAGGYAVIPGALGRAAPYLRALSDVPLLLVNPPPDTAMGNGISGLRLDRDWTALPLAPSSARAIAFGDATTGNQLLAGLSVVRPGGRVLAPIALALPDAVAELARDDRQWVAERRVAVREAGIITLERRARD